MYLPMTAIHSTGIPIFLHLNLHLGDVVFCIPLDELIYDVEIDFSLCQGDTSVLCLGVETFESFFNLLIGAKVIPTEKLPGLDTFNLNPFPLDLLLFTHIR